MKFRFICFKSINHYLSILFIFFFISFSTSLFAQERKQLESEKVRLEREIKNLNQELKSTQQNKNTSTKQLSLIKKKIQEREKLITNINHQIVILDKEIDETVKGINKLHTQIDSLKSEYAKIIRMLYKQKDMNSSLVLLFNSQDFNQAYQRMKFFKDYNAYRKMQANQIKKKESELETINNKLEQKKIDQAKLLAEEQQQKQKLSRDQTQTQKSINTIRAQETKISKDLKDKQNRARKLQQQIDKMIAEEVRKRQEEKLARDRAAARAAAKAAKEGKTDNTTVPSAPKVIPKENYKVASTPEDIKLSNSFIENKGKLPWPTEKAAILIPYGEYTHPESGGKNFNSGLIILTEKGSNVRSVFDGTVSAIGTDLGGQKVVMVNHGEFISVYTNIERLLVSKGTKIKAKQAIGVIHDSPNNKQSEINFQIWKATSSQNPAIWLAPLR